MSGFFIQRNGFTDVNKLIASVSTDMVANGFSRKFPGLTPIASPAPDAFTITMEAGTLVDPLAATQPWRVSFRVTSKFECQMYVASDIQLPDDGTISTLERRKKPAAGAAANTIEVESAGVIGSDLKYPYKQDATTIIPPIPYANQALTIDAAAAWDLVRINESDRKFIDRSNRIPDAITAAANPMSYVLSISARGFSLCVWEESAVSAASNFSWVVVQRPVDRTTGAALVDPASRCPLFCVYGLEDRYIPAAIKSEGNTTSIIVPERWESGIRRFIVRERDVLTPTASVPATYDTEDTNAILNAHNQVAITEDNKYVVTFPNKLNTPRYAYTQELDMLAYTSAEVVARNAEIPLTVYGEAAPRIYKALVASGLQDTKMRLLLLMQGGGIDPATPAA